MYRVVASIGRATWASSCADILRVHPSFHSCQLASGSILLNSSLRGSPTIAQPPNCRAGFHNKINATQLPRRKQKKERKGKGKDNSESKGKYISNDNFRALFELSPVRTLVGNSSAKKRPKPEWKTKKKDGLRSGPRLKPAKVRRRLKREMERAALCGEIIPDTQEGSIKLEGKPKPKVQYRPKHKKPKPPSMPPAEREKHEAERIERRNEKLKIQYGDKWLDAVEAIKNRALALKAERKKTNESHRTQRRRLMKEQEERDARIRDKTREAEASHGAAMRRIGKRIEKNTMLVPLDEIGPGPGMVSYRPLGKFSERT
ncbi:uncharacterized protein BCR38DRAFT_451188 [Pseudomassariella vexata]|uniref:Uncharacterized protein n=1 Tax=Pseudomassariella vexata TaxID=1141098 RepID=A0A1Y2DAS9_9PEZI|nr:uncharacterized protein BCR38DRAFT_451188 [Pseudomassariella vexata]ORY56370.1 hypothetical protein BCR38DRAFT_451188 [Pseudomassariella vexata]